MFIANQPHTATQPHTVEQPDERLVQDSLSCNIGGPEQGNGEPEGAAFSKLGHGSYETPKNGNLLGADTEAKPCPSPCARPLHVIFCSLVDMQRCSITMAQHSIPQHCTVQRSQAQHSMAQPSQTELSSIT